MALLEHLQAIFYFPVICAGEPAHDNAQRPYHFHAGMGSADAFSGAALKEKRIFGRKDKGPGIAINGVVEGCKIQVRHCQQIGNI